MEDFHIEQLEAKIKILVLRVFSNKCSKCLLQCIPTLIKLWVIEAMIIQKAHTNKVRWRDPMTKPNMDQQIQVVLSVQR
jgi:hypothetical protein